MGVSGVGKSEIGMRLASTLGITYVEGDDYHTPGNVTKMARGIPLDDVDRREWLQSLRSRIEVAKEREQSIVLTCSALKRRYRDFLREADPHLFFIHLFGESDLIASRMRHRRGHFMPPLLLASQFRDLEPPLQDENALSLDIRKTPDQIISEIVQNTIERTATHGNEIT
jgi:gluconokinase